MRSALSRRYVVQAIVSSFLPLSGIARGPRRFNGCPLAGKALAVKCPAIFLLPRGRVCFILSRAECREASAPYPTRGLVVGRTALCQCASIPPVCPQEGTSTTQPGHNTLALGSAAGPRGRWACLGALTPPTPQCRYAALQALGVGCRA